MALSLFSDPYLTGLEREVRAGAASDIDCMSGLRYQGRPANMAGPMVLESTLAPCRHGRPDASAAHAQHGHAVWGCN